MILSHQQPQSSPTATTPKNRHHWLLIGRTSYLEGDIKAQFTVYRKRPTAFLTFLGTNYEVYTREPRESCRSHNRSQWGVHKLQPSAVWRHIVSQMRTNVLEETSSSNKRNDQWLLSSYSTGNEAGAAGGYPEMLAPIKPHDVESQRS